MSDVQQENPDISPTSGAEDSDVLLAPAAEPEPIPGLNGVPVRCEYANIYRGLFLKEIYAKGMMYVSSLVFRNIFFEFWHARRTERNLTPG
jgi:hypothetical protein